MKWWRKLPGWHRREVEFRDWYVGLLDRLNFSTDVAYDMAVRALKCPEEVTGYREVRYPKQDRARQAVESELARPPQRETHVRHDMLGGFRTPTTV
jgi:indolepyruvate ferredoxin oxidoreductase